MACAEALPRACITLGRRGSRYTGKRRLAGDTARGIATTDEVKQLRREAQDLKEALAEQALELRLLKNSMARPFASGFRHNGLTNLLQRIGSRYQFPDQDGDLREHPIGQYSI
jgi:hypothetical protein